MKIIHIKDKLAEIGVDWRTINLGHFDQLGEYTARKFRSPNEPLFKTVGWSFRPQYERGILLYYLVKQLGIQSFIEVGFGRGFSSLCVAKAFYDLGIQGRILSIDINYDEKHMNLLKQVIPVDLLSKVDLRIGSSQELLPKLSENFDFAYIDGNHSAEGTLFDWEQIHPRVNTALLFDDYHLPTKNDGGIKCAEAIDGIDFDAMNFEKPELIRLDRRIFIDDRRFTDEEINYGQVLVMKKKSSEEW